VNGRTGDVVHTDRGDLSAPIVVDALGWRRVLGSGYQPPDAPLSRGLEVHPWGAGDEMELWIDRRYVPAGYGWSFPADEEVRVGVGSFDPRFHVKDTTVMLAEDLDREPVRYQGNWIPHRLRAATDDGVFFVGDSAGHCLPLTAEGIRTALYFGIACARRPGWRAADRLGAGPLRRLLGGAPLEVRGDARRPAARPARAAAPAAPLDPRDAGEALRGLELRPLPGHRPAELRGRRAATFRPPAADGGRRLRRSRALSEIGEPRCANVSNSRSRCAGTHPERWRAPFWLTPSTRQG
jgi:hypothetical protein